jgi:hypothetical protein
MNFETWFMSALGHTKGLLKPEEFWQFKYACHLAWNAGIRSAEVSLFTDCRPGIDGQ